MNYSSITQYFEYSTSYLSTSTVIVLEYTCTASITKESDIGRNIDDCRLPTDTSRETSLKWVLSGWMLDCSDKNNESEYTRVLHTVFAYSESNEGDGFLAPAAAARRQSHKI